MDPVSHVGLALLSQRPVEQVRQPDTRSLEPIPDERDVLFEMLRVHDDRLLVLAFREGFVSLLVEALRNKYEERPRAPVRDQAPVVSHPRGATVSECIDHQIRTQGLPESHRLCTFRPR